MPTAITPRRLMAAAVIIIVAALLIFYLDRAFMAAPIFAGDEGSYLIRALYPPAASTLDPWVANVSNSVYFAVIRLVYWLSPDRALVWLRLVSLAAYVGGLAAVWTACARNLAPSQRWACLLLALAFPYYRFVVAVLPEGIYVGLLALIGVATVAFYARRPLVHAALTGGLAAGLILVKPHGAAVAAAFAALCVLDLLLGERPVRTGLRLALFLAVFLGAGNLIQHAAGQPVSSFLTFFVADYYNASLKAALPAGAWKFGVLALFSMGSALVMLAGAPITAALVRVWARRRAEGRHFRLAGEEALPLLLMLSAAATLFMVAIFAMKVSVDPGETKRLWGRYFEFYAPLLWLSAAPALAALEGAEQQRWRLAAAALTTAGLVGLIISFKAGIVLFPWDSTALLAFFHPDPVRAALGLKVPYRWLAVAATALAILALLTRAQSARAALGYFLALGLLSTWLDHVWLGPMVQKRTQFEAEVEVAAGLLPDAPDRNVALVADNNDAHLSFLGLHGLTNVRPAAPNTPPPPEEVAPYDHAVVVAPAAPPAHWTCPFAGRQVSVCEPPAAAAPAP